MPRVKCPSCGEVYLETTDEYKPDTMPTGDMFRFIEKYGPKGYNWSLPFDVMSIGEAIECPGCGAPVAGIGGKSIMLEDEEDGEQKDSEEAQKEGQSEEEIAQPVSVHVCQECGKSCKTAGALFGHMKTHIGVTQ